MIIRNKVGEYRAGTGDVLLDYLRGELGLRSDECGVRNVAGDLELIVPVPFCLAVEEGENSNAVAWTFSTFDLDRFGERIDPAGWDYKHYMDNPVIEWAHRYDIPAIGKAEHIYADDKGLHGSIVFNDKDYDPFGWAIGERVKAGVIRAGSVGFRVIEIELPSQEDSRDGTTLIFRKQELLEFSICNVPANPWALVKPLALSKSEELGVRNTSEESGVRSGGISPDFWGNFIGGSNG
jgi:HK97 family phage prohead protease